MRPSLGALDAVAGNQEPRLASEPLSSRRPFTSDGRSKPKAAECSRLCVSEEAVCVARRKSAFSFSSRACGDARLRRRADICAAMDAAAQAVALADGDKVNASSYASRRKAGIFSLLRAAAGLGVASSVTQTDDDASAARAGRA